MPSKKVMMFLAAVGSIVGGYIPSLFGASMLSFSSIFTSAAGALFGIWLGYKLTK